MANKTFPYAVIIDGEIIPAGTPIKAKGKAPDTSSEAGAKNDECADTSEGSAAEEAESKKAGAKNDDTGTNKKS